VAGAGRVILFQHAQRLCALPTAHVRSIRRTAPDAPGALELRLWPLPAVSETGEVTDRWLPDGRIERTWSRGGDEGHGTVVWELSRDGALLSAHATAHNPHCEGAMQYTTPYRRAGDAPAH